jgi:hypothetical protein
MRRSADRDGGLAVVRTLRAAPRHSAMVRVGRSHVAPRVDASATDRGHRWERVAVACVKRNNTFCGKYCGGCGVCGGGKEDFEPQRYRGTK